MASSSFQAKERKKEKKPWRKKKYRERKELTFKLLLCSALSLLALPSGLLFLLFRFKHFFLGIFFSSSRRKKIKTKRQKKTIEKKKKL